MPIAIHISTGSTAPIYRQIVDQVARAAATGGLAPEDPLPSVRALAERLVVNPNTVARAYSELIREGVVESRAGRGVFLANRRSVLSGRERSRRIDEALDAFLHEALLLGLNVDQIRKSVETKLRQLKRESAS